MKLIVILSLLIVFLVPSTYKYNITIVMTFIWFLYSLYFFVKIHKLKDKKLVTSKYLVYPPNNNNSSYIRYLYKKNIDYKIFVATIIELLIKKSISFKIIDKDNYYIVDNKNTNEVLNKSETYVKKIIFKDIGDRDEVSLRNIKRKCLKNSGYIFSVYKEWQNIFEYESVSNKYFVSNKNIIDKSLGYFIISFIIGLYNIFFTKNILIALIMLCITGYLCNYINNMRNLEEEAKVEYENWLKFKNYIDKYDNSLDELDGITLENYATYAYVLDSYESFIRILNKKRNKDNNYFSDSELLKLMISGVFDDIENTLKNSINIIDFKTKVLFSKNKGRR